jgi:hypothetical protein
MTSYISCESTSVPLYVALNDYDELNVAYVHFSNMCGATPSPLDILQTFVSSSDEFEELKMSIRPIIDGCIIQKITNVNTWMPASGSLDYADFKNCVGLTNLNTIIDIKISHLTGELFVDSESSNIDINLLDFNYQEGSYNFIVEIIFRVNKNNVYKNGDKYLVKTVYFIDDKVPIMIGHFERTTTALPKSKKRKLFWE